MTSANHDRKSPTLNDFRNRQAAYGARKYPTALVDAGLSVGALASHTMQERVDIENYLRTADLWNSLDEIYFASLDCRLLPVADHPLPPPPDVPTAEAVATYGNWWQLGTEVVYVGDVGLEGGGMGVKFADMAGFHPMDPDEYWLGPVPMRAVRP